MLAEPHWPLSALRSCDVKKASDVFLLPARSYELGWADHFGFKLVVMVVVMVVRSDKEEMTKYVEQSIRRTIVLLTVRHD